MKRINLVLACVGLSLALAPVAGCGTARRSEPLIGPKVPPNDVIARGELAFDKNCNACHPGGEAGVGVALNSKPLPRWLITFQARHGLGAMPKFPKDTISDQQLDEIASYLIWLHKQS